MLLHRAILGTLERFLGILLEHHADGLPVWLAPEQAAILPVAADRGYPSRVAALLAQGGVRARIDDRDETLSRRVLSAHEAGSAYTIVVGPREAASGSVSLRRGSTQNRLPLGEAVTKLEQECRPPV